MLRCRRSALLAAVVYAVAAAVPHGAAAVVGGPQADVAEAPWTVRVLANDGSAFCTGVIIGPTEVITAAHCVFAGDGSEQPPSNLSVNAGLSSVNDGADLSGLQHRDVSAITVHPYYDPTTGEDDVAMLTVASFDFSGPRVQPITLAPVVPAIDAPGRFFGWGSQGGYSSDGYLHSLDETFSNQGFCSKVADDPVQECALSSVGSICHGDSGGGIVSTSGVAMLLGLASQIGSYFCDPGTPDLYVNVAAPEIRDFLMGNTAPPRAPRISSDVTITAQPGIATCQPGTWSGNPQFSYTFVDADTNAVLQTGSSPDYIYRTVLGQISVLCDLTATNAGGTTVASSTAVTLAGPTYPGLMVSPTKGAYTLRWVANPVADRLQIFVARFGHVVSRLRAAPPANANEALLLLPTLRTGTYHVCLTTPGTFGYVPGRACIKRRVASNARGAGGHQPPTSWRVRLSIADFDVGHRAVLVWQVGQRTVIRHVILRAAMELSSPPVSPNSLVLLSLAPIDSTFNYTVFFAEDISRR